VNKSTIHLKDQILLVKESVSQLSDVMVEEFETLRSHFTAEIAALSQQT
jgi:hypothetical protein